jgi:hypothetical protein
MNHVRLMMRVLPSVLLVACGGAAVDRAANDGVTSIALIDSVAVGETDSVFVGKPNAIAVDAAGRVYIADASTKRVLRVERDGTGLVPITRSGGGPGEVMRPISLALIGDSVLAVQDAGKRSAELFDRASMQPRGSVAMGWPSTAIRGWHDGLVVGALMADSGAAYALLRDTVAAPRRGGSVPRIYTEYPPIAQAFGSVEVARDDSTVVGVFEASGTVYRWHLASKQIDSVAVAVSTRRGARSDVMLELLRDPTKAPTLAYTWSFPMLVGMISGDRSAMVTHDPTLANGTFTGPAHVQVVDWRSKRSCREVQLPVSAEIPARYAMRGDTLTALVQHADGEAAGTWIVRWVVGAARC